MGAGILGPALPFLLLGSITGIMCAAGLKFTLTPLQFMPLCVPKSLLFEVKWHLAPKAPISIFPWMWQPSNLRWISDHIGRSLSSVVEIYRVKGRKEFGRINASTFKPSPLRKLYTTGLASHQRWWDHCGLPCLSSPMLAFLWPPAPSPGLSRVPGS